MNAAFLVFPAVKFLPPLAVKSITKESAQIQKGLPGIKAGLQTRDINKQNLFFSFSS
jgi:hypothetical protein